ncbi:MAG: transcription elongation factor GreA [Patescibacteria group bacterium]
MPKSYVSKQKYKELGNELDYLKTTRRKEIAEKLEYAKSLGDLSENAEYHEARDDQAGTEKRILELEDILKHAQMVEKHHSEVVEIGSAIVVKKTGEKDEKKYQIVGSEEADTGAGKISYLSPLGAALMGKKKGDKTSFQSPVGKVEYSIVEIE